MIDSVGLSAEIYDTLTVMATAMRMVMVMVPGAILSHAGRVS